jgi:hypothetical protein
MYNSGGGEGQRHSVAEMNTCVCIMQPRAPVECLSKQTQTCFNPPRLKTYSDRHSVTD